MSHAHEGPAVNAPFALMHSRWPDVAIRLAIGTYVLHEACEIQHSARTAAEYSL